MLIIGEDERGWFGASATPISNKEAAELELNSSDGLILRGVEKVSPAETSGLKKKISLLNSTITLSTILLSFVANY